MIIKLTHKENGNAGVEEELQNFESYARIGDFMDFLKQEDSKTRVILRYGPCGQVTSAKVIGENKKGRGSALRVLYNLGFTGETN